MGDFSMDYDLVGRMRTFPVGVRQLAATAIFLFLPYAALALTHVSLVELLREMVAKAL
jgi:hypothetical protein